VRNADGATLRHAVLVYRFAGDLISEILILP
jgi:hypothetical protein